MSNDNFGLRNPDEAAPSCVDRSTSVALNDFPEYENDEDLAIAASKESYLSMIGDNDPLKD